MYNTVEQVTFKNISATTAAFTLRGGNYGITVTGTFGGGSVTLQRLGQDGSTYATCALAFTTAGYANVNLPAGTYQLAIATATAVYADVTSTVTSM